MPRVFEGREYSNDHEDLVAYLRRKHGLDDREARAILRDTFRYIETEVMCGKAGFMAVPRFGRFERRNFTNMWGTGLVLKLDRRAVSKNGTSYLNKEDEEWVDD